MHFRWASEISLSRASNYGLMDFMPLAESGSTSFAQITSCDWCQLENWL